MAEPFEPTDFNYAGIDPSKAVVANTQKAMRLVCHKMYDRPAQSSSLSHVEFKSTETEVQWRSGGDCTYTVQIRGATDRQYDMTDSNGMQLLTLKMEPMPGAESDSCCCTLLDARGSGRVYGRLVATDKGGYAYIDESGQALWLVKAPMIPKKYSREPFKRVGHGGHAVAFRVRHALSEQVIAAIDEDDERLSLSPGMDPVPVCAFYAVYQELELGRAGAEEDGSYFTTENVAELGMGLLGSILSGGRGVTVDLKKSKASKPS